MNTYELITITVTYHPDLELLRTQLLSLPNDSLKLIVDNASGVQDRKVMQDISNNIAHTYLIENPVNVGLATAFNQGVAQARQLRPLAQWCLLLDQDSEPQPGSIASLLEGVEHLKQRGEQVGCVGPVLIDAITGLSHGFHQATRWYWRRTYPLPYAKEPVPCTNLNGSGTLVSIDIFNKTGGLDESLFIDHVDTEWSFRILSLGYTLWGIPTAIFLHRMGQSSFRYWLFGWRVWPQRSPLRHYYLFRNAIWLMKRSYIAPVWKFWVVVKLILTFFAHALFDSQRRPQLQAMIQGLRRGLE